MFLLKSSANCCWVKESPVAESWSAVKSESKSSGSSVDVLSSFLFPSANKSSKFSDPSSSVLAEDVASVSSFLFFADSTSLSIALACSKLPKTSWLS